MIAEQKFKFFGNHYLFGTPPPFSKLYLKIEKFNNCIFPKLYLGQITDEKHQND